MRKYWILLAILTVAGAAILAGCPVDDDGPGDDDDASGGGDDASPDDDESEDDDSADDDDGTADDDDSSGDDDDDDDGSPECAPEGSEPNGTAGTATVLEAGVVLDALALLPGDEDWFLVAACPGAEIELLWTAQDGALAADLALFGPGLVLLEERSAVSGPQTFSVDPATGSTYWLRIRGSSSPDCASYSLLASADVSGCDAACLPDAEEEDDQPGGFLDAIESSPYSLSGLTLAADDPDFTPVLLCAGSTITASASWDDSQGAAVELALVDGFGIEASGVGVPTRADYALQYTANDAGLLWIRATLESGTCVGYELDVELADTSCAGTCFDDFFEPNQSAEESVPVLPGETVTPLVALQGDADWFSLEACEGALVDVDLAWDPAGGAVAAELLDSGGGLLAAAVPGPGPGQSAINWTNSSGADASLSLVAELVSGACNFYSVSVAVDESACPFTCTDDALEDNDAIGQSEQVADGGALYGLVAMPGDADWFWIPVCAGGVLDVVLEEAAGTDPTTMSLLSVMLQPIGTVTATPDGWTAEWESTAGGSAFVKVETTGALCSQYELSFLVDDSLCCPQDANEPDDTSADATEVLGTTTFSGMTQSTGDSDWFAVPLCAGAELSAAFASDWPNANLDMLLVDASGNVLDSAADFLAAESVAWTAATEQTVWLELFSVWGDCSSYLIDFTVDSTACPGPPGGDDDSAGDDDDSAAPGDDDSAAPGDDDSAGPP
jgi:hypothetical protein